MNDRLVLQATCGRQDGAAERYRAMASGIRMLMSFAKTLAAYRTGILAYYDYRISTGPLEGTNNKIIPGSV